MARGLRRLALALAALPLAIGLYLLVACALLLLPANRGAAPAPPTIPAWVLSNGVHTDIVLPVVAAGIDWRSVFPPADARAAPPDAAYLAIGWGDREFYLHTPTWADLTVGRALGAVLGRNPALLHITWLRRDEVRPGSAWRLPLDGAQYRRLAQHLVAQLPVGAPARAVPGAHYAGNDAFYEAAGRYHLFETCNSWTGRALRHAGVPMGRWTPFDFTVTWHLAPLRD